MARGAVAVMASAAAVAGGFADAPTGFQLWMLLAVAVLTGVSAVPISKSLQKNLLYW